MGGAPVVFNYENWVARYPEFAGVPPSLAQEYFGEATLYFSNCGWTVGLQQAPALLNMLTAHIAQLNAPLGGQPSPTLVGRISNATEGSVSVAVELEGSGSPSQAFFAQTKYGLAFFQATLQFRSAVYVKSPFPPPQTVLYGGIGPYGYGRGRT